MTKVYSTEFGSLCKSCGEPEHDGRCQAELSKVLGDGKVRIRRETKGRKGAGVTVVEGIPFSEPDLKALHKKLKKQCGVGGSVKKGVLEFQGDHRARLLELLSDLEQARAWDIRLSGS